MKIALNGQQLAATHPLPRLLDVLDAHGVKGVELWPGNLPGEGAGEAGQRWETRDVREAARLLRARGIEVACVTLGFGAAPRCFAKGGGVRYTEALCGAVDAAVTLGAALVNTYSAGLPLSLWCEAVGPAAAYAAERGVVITLENEAHDESGSPANVAAAITRVNSRGLGTQYDPCNYYHAMVEPFPHAYEVIRPHLAYVHLKGGCIFREAGSRVHRGSTMRDSTRGHIGYLPLPRAAFNVAAILHALRVDGYRGWVTLEPHVPVTEVESFYAVEIQFLRSLIAAQEGRGSTLT